MKTITIIIFGCLLLASCGENQKNSSENIPEVPKDKIATTEDVMRILDKYEFEYRQSSNPKEITETVGELEERIKELALLRDEIEKNNPDANKPLTEDQYDIMQFYKKAASIKNTDERNKYIVENKEFLIERGESAEFIEDIEKHLKLRGIEFESTKE